MQPHSNAATRCKTLLALTTTAAVLFGVVNAAAGTAAAAPIRALEVREVRTIETNEYGAARPTGVAYDPNRGELLVASSSGAGTSILRLTTHEEARGALILPRLSNPGTLAFDKANDRLSAVGAKEQVTTSGRDLESAQPSTSRRSTSHLDISDPAGATFDTTRGKLLVLDAANGTVVVDSSSGTSAPTRFSLKGLGTSNFKGLAFNPEDGLVYVGAPDQKKLYGLDASGDVRKTFSLAGLDLNSPTGMTFAPSADNTDDPATQHLFIADEGTAATSGGIIEVSLAVEAVAALAPTTDTAVLVRMIPTSGFVPSSPDPSGIEYSPGTDRLFIVDSEVEETTGAGYHGVNLWTVTRDGVVTDRGTTYPAFSKEPTGLGYDPTTNTLFISDDSKNYVWVVKTGPDQRFGTADDTTTFVNAGAYGSSDTEDPEFDYSTGQPTSGHLFFLDGINREIYDVDPVDAIFGNGNDVMTHFDISWLGPTDFEGLGQDAARGTLLVGARKTKQIFEITKSGELVRTINVSGVAGMKYISGLQAAPASDGSGRLNYWIVDRGTDNGSNSSENDGRLFEVTVPGSDAPPTVGLTSPADGAVLTGTVSLQATATDDTGVNRVEFFDGTTSLGLAVHGAGNNWSLNWNTTTATEGPHALKAVATDTINQSTTSAIVNVTVDNVDGPPTASITSPTNGSALRATVSLQATATDDDAVNKVEFFDGTTSLGLAVHGAGNSWSLNWDTTTASGGPHALTAVATDTINQSTTSAIVNVTVDNIAPSAVNITAPPSGATVTQTVPVTATAADNQVVARVQFFVDGTTSIGTDTDGSNGWSVNWVTAMTANGSHSLTAVASDAAGNATTSVPVPVTVSNATVATLDVSILAINDDVEERNATGSIDLDSSDLELMLEKTTTQPAVGLRFTGLAIPAGAVVTNAYVQFQVNEVGSATTNLVVKAQAIDNAPAFTTATFDVTSRVTTSANVPWAVAPWNVNNARGPDQRTPDIRSVLQEVIDRPGWASGNAVAVIITGTGKRVADSFGGSNFAPLLHIEYTMS